MASELTAAELAELKEKVKADKHGWSSIRAEWLSALIAAAERVCEAEKALIACHTDIGHWLQLARYQREKMDQNLGWCPTEDGIARSEMVRSQISTALGKEPRT